MTLRKIKKHIIDAAIQGLEEQKRQIDIQIRELRAMAARDSAAAPVEVEPAKRLHRKMSATRRKAIAEVQRKRWAAAKVESEPKPSSKSKRKLSATGRANIVAALKKRWAAKKTARVKRAA